MTAQIKEKLYTLEEYFELERHSEIRHEFVNGKLIPMPGDSRRNNKISINCVVALKLALKGSKCEIYDQSVRLITEPKRKYRYPDVMVTCAEEPDTHAVQLPFLIIEVLSPGTEGTDRNEKLKEYLNIQALQYYLLISQDMPSIEVYSRNGTQWQYHFYSHLEEIMTFSDLNIQIALKDIYEGITFESVTDQ